MKRNLAFVCLSGLLVFSGFAADQVVDGITWSYSTSNGEAQVTGANPAEGEITIPAVLGNCPVTKLGYRAFYSKTKLKSVRFPPSLTTVYSYPFEGAGVTNLYLPSHFKGNVNTSTWRISSLSIITYYDPVELVVSSDNSDVVPSVGTYRHIPKTPCDCYAFGTDSDETGARTACIGWIGTGSVPETGSTTNCNFSIDENSILIWKWQQQVRITTSVENGRSSAKTQWVKRGSTASVEIRPSLHPFSMSLTGDTNDVRLSGTTLSIPADMKRDIHVTVGRGTEPTLISEPDNGITWTYYVDAGESFIYGGSLDAAIDTNTEGSVVIPDSLGGHPVSGIGNNAFAGCQQITSVTVPDTVRSIGDDAFSGCNGLTSVLFVGDAPIAVASSALEGLGDGCVIHVRPGSTGWGETLPGTWNGLSVVADVARLDTSVIGLGSVIGGGYYVSGMQANLSAVSGDGHVFSSWAGDITGDTSNTIATVSSDMTAVAQFIPETSVTRIVNDFAEQNGYYTRDQIHELAIGNLMFDVDAGKARIGVKLMESSDLTNPDGWTPVELSASDLDIGDDGSVGMSVNADAGVRFFRLEAP